MPRRSEFVDFILEQLAPQGAPRAKSMFGGVGLYLNDLFCGIVFDDVLYLKTDEGNRQRFQAIGASPFQYATKDGQTMELSYYPPPESCLDDPEELAEWVRGAVDAALRAKSAKARKTRRQR
jgi:DNA transformation protein